MSLTRNCGGTKTVAAIDWQVICRNYIIGIRFRPKVKPHLTPLIIDSVRPLVHDFITWSRLVVGQRDLLFCCRHSLNYHLTQTLHGSQRAGDAPGEHRTPRGMRLCRLNIPDRPGKGQVRSCPAPSVFLFLTGEYCPQTFEQQNIWSVFPLQIKFSETRRLNKEKRGRSCWTLPGFRL